ncbi:unnamed protein product [Amoebophrya sp. A25]|nr:unnamed protein product [Amoebophrya sp. A25]|eukprot:GSA25T00017200001.1
MEEEKKEDPALRVVFRSPRVYRSHILDRIAVAWTIQAWKNREGIQDWDLLTSKPLPRSVEDAGIEEMLSMLEKCSIHDQVGNSKLTTSSSSTTTFSAKVQDSPDLQARKFSYRATMHEEIEGPGEEQYSFAEAYPLRTELLQALNALGLEFCRAWAYTEYVVEEIIEDDAGQGSFCLDQGGGKIRSKISSGSSFDSSSSISTSRNSCSTRKTSFSTRGTPTATSCTSSALSSSSSRTSRVRGISSLESIADIDEEDDSACFREDDSTSEVFLPIICSPAEVLFSPRTSQKYSIGGSGSDTGALKHCKNATSSYNADSSSSARPTPVAKKKKKLHWCTLRIVCENGLTNLLRAMVEYADMSPQLGRVFDFQCWALCEQYPDIFLEVLGKPVLHEDPRQKKIGQGLGSRAASRTITKCCTSLHQKVEHEDVKRIIFELSSMAPMEGGDESCMLDDFFGEIVAVVGGGVDHFVDSTTEEEKEVEEVVEGMQTDDLGPQDCDEDEVTRLFLQAQAELEEEEQEQELQGKTTLLGDLLDPANFILGEDSMALEHEAVEEQLQSHHQRPPLQQHKTNYVGDRELTLADLQTIACDCASVQKRLQSLSFRNGPLTRGRNSMTGNGGVLGRTTIGAQELEGAQQFLGPAPVIPAVDHAAAENQQQILGAQLDPSCTVFPSNTAFPSVVLSGEDSGGAGAAGDKKRSRALSSMTAHSSGSSASGGSQIAVVDIDDIGLEWTENENVANLVLKPSSSTTSSTNQRQQSSTYDSTSTTDAGSSLSDEGKNESFSTNWATSAKMGTGKTFFTSAASGTSAPSGTVGKKITTFSNTTSTSETSVHHENAKKNKTTSISSPPKFVLSTFALNCSNECVPSVLGIAVDQYVSLSKPDAKLPSELLDRVRRDHDQQM